MSTETSPKVFIIDSEIEWEQVGEGVKRKIVAYNDQLMLTKVAFEKGGVGALHHHYHSQISHVESGAFEIQIGDDKKLLKAGDAYIVPPHAVHGAVCVEAGVLVDAFSPYREDFIQQTK
ncbi:MAG: cupin domain-containing protein [Williamsia sp.]|nr:cupin domain-containing protein [Williamsia sp.]